MFVADWKFQVLSPVFAIHWGLQQKKGRPGWRERQNNNNRRRFNKFKSEIYARYGKTPPTTAPKQKASHKPKKLIPPSEKPTNTSKLEKPATQENKV